MDLFSKVLCALTVIAGFLSAASAILPDTTPGSPRSLAIALGGVLVALVVLLKMVYAALEPPVPVSPPVQVPSSR